MRNRAPRRAFAAGRELISLEFSNIGEAGSVSGLGILLRLGMEMSQRFMRRAATLIFPLAALTVGPSSVAVAAEAISLSLGGYIHQYFFVAGQDEAAGENFNAAGMFSDTRLSFEGRTILDNGIVVRAYARLLAETNSQPNADEVYVEVRSSLGRLRLGEKAGANTSTIGDPVPQAFLTVYDEVVGDALVKRTGVTLEDAFTFRRFTGNALGVSYQSPELLGFTVGFAYHPKASLGESPVDNNLVPHNAYDVTGGYQGYYPGGSYRVAAGYFHSDSSSLGTDGVEAWNLAAGLSYGGWEFAGAYMNLSPDGNPKETAWTVGALYGIGPWQLSADYRTSKRRPFAGAAIQERAERATLQTAYKVGPGISLGLAGFYAQQDDSAGTSWDGGGVLGGVKVGF
jgi:predicted porin